MKMGIILAGILCCGSVVRAATITDDFNRADTVFSTDGSQIGASWVNGAGTTNVWAIGSSNLMLQVYGTETPATTAGPSILYNDSLQTTSGGGMSFTLSADLQPVSNRWVGLVFNYQNPSNYYEFRVAGDSSKYQFVAVNDGVASAKINRTDAVVPFTSDTFYTLTVSSDAAYEYRFSITEAGSAVALNPTTTGSDSSESFTGGYAGLYQAGGWTVDPLTLYDNFYLSTYITPKTFFDSFERAGTVSGLGGDWASDSLYKVDNNEAETRYTSHTAVKDVAWNTAVSTVSGNGAGFTLSADVRGSAGGRMIGIAFNVQDEANYYALLAIVGQSTYRVAQMSDGTLSWLVNKTDATGTFDAGADLTMTVTSDAVGTYSFTIASAGVVLNPTTSFTDTTSPFTGGYAGLFSDGNIGTFNYDDFLLRVVAPQEALNDTFERADTVSGLGGDWTSDDLYYVDNSEAETKYTSNTTVKDVAWNTAVSTVSGGGTNFMLSADVRCSSGARLFGIAFNVQDENNYYALLASAGSTTYRVAQMSGGTLSWLVNKTDASSAFAAGTDYTMSVSSDEVGTYEFTITEAESSTVLNPTTSVTDGATPFEGGYAGLFSDGNNGTFNYNNFQLLLFYPVADVEPTPAELYTSWRAGYTLGSQTNLTDDLDEDSLDNLAEYALGGNPETDDAVSILPTSVLDDGVLMYVYNRRTDAEARGLSYTVVMDTDLISTPEGWTTNGITEVDSADLSNGFESVTNTVPVDMDVKFLKLLIESNL